MTTIVMNTLNAAVTEYDWAFQSITPTHGGSATGLYLLGGDGDNAVAIDAQITTGKTQWGTSLRKRMTDAVFLAIRGAGQGLLRVIGSSAWSYRFDVRSTGQSRAQPGQGINESYLAFGYSNVDGADFILDHIEIPMTESQSRRT